MSLSADQIKALLALPQKKRGGKRKAGIDTSVRDYKTWFLLAHKILDDETGELAKCENPNCPDTRDPYKTVVAMVSGQYMCRICFMEGWMSINPNQTQIESVVDNE
jgi:hypothetical protein